MKNSILKLPLIILFLLFGSERLSAQVQVHNDMRTKYWNLIGLRYEKQVKPLEWKVFFPAELKALNNKTIELPGYIIPTKVGNKFSEFMLSVVPIESCPFCGSGDIPSMVEVKMNNPINYTSKPIKLKGKIIINDSGDKRSEFFLLDAVQL
ncbi:hypothetical protein QWY86_03540 [Pedobacter aquatilis]|uniref:hypothetical protein n=1 Tax=Pedobacter aquatilis TaxID=351343 RepID=UPI0025B56E04|nr:hypothetical protein [Pedobacter aquatilis]MDN3585724.1 hypothetical protein [Pedobacter aquatilis]